MELNKKTLKHIFLGVAGCILLYWLLHETDQVSRVIKDGIAVLSPFLIGAAVAFILNVPMRAIESKLKKIKNDKARRAVAVLITIFSVLVVLTGVVWLIVPQLIKTIESLLEALPAFFDRVYSNTMEFLADNPDLWNWLKTNTKLEALDWAGMLEKMATWLGKSLTKVLNKATMAVGTVSTGLFNGVIGIVFGVYCLVGKEKLAAQGRKLLYAFLPEHVGDEIVRVLRMSNSTFSNFISGQCLEALILGSMFAVSMLIFNMPYIPLISVIIAVTALVPIVGAFVGCVIGAFFILVESPVLAFWFVVLFLVLQQIEGNLIYPKVVGSSIGLPGMWVLVAVAVGGDLMGVGGMLLMIPAASVLYALLREFTQKRLEARGIDPDKLRAHPPELRSHFKEKREKAKIKRQQKKAAKVAVKVKDDED